MIHHYLYRFFSLILLLLCISGCGEDLSFLLETLANTSSSSTVNTASRQSDQPLTILQNPQAISIMQGEALRLDVRVSGNGPLNYRWHKNGKVIYGHNSSTYFVASSQQENSGHYQVIVSNNKERVYSNLAYVWVSQELKPVTITHQPASLMVSAGSNARLSVSASGSEPLRYQWRKNGEYVNQGISSSLYLNMIHQSDAGQYDVIISNPAGSVVSTPASVQVIASKPLPEITQPEYQDITERNIINPPPATRHTLQLSWDRPQFREDGSTLLAEEIKAYTIQYGRNATLLEHQIVIPHTQGNQHIFTGLPTGPMYFRIATIDTDSHQGAFSDIIRVDIQ